MGWEKEQVQELITDLDPKHDGKITHEEFILILKYIEQKNSQSPSVGKGLSPSHKASNSTISKSGLPSLNENRSMNKSQISVEQSVYNIDK